MTLVIAVQIAALVLLFFCSAFLSSAETALFSLNAIQIQRIRKQNGRGGERIARRAGLTHMPIHDAATETFVGIINVFYALSHDGKDPNRKVTDFMRPPLFIPADMPVEDIFPRLRRFRQPMCLVTDEASRVSGLITTEDILEEIVGQL